jgi:hypothetical protein
MRNPVGTAEMYSAAEISAVTGASVKAVYKVVADRLPHGLSIQHDRQRYLTREGAACFVIDREMPKDVPLAVRRQLYADILERQAAPWVQYDRGILSYVVNVKAAAGRVDQDLARYREAMRLIDQNRPGCLKPNSIMFGFSPGW